MRNLINIIILSILTVSNLYATSKVLFGNSLVDFRFYLGIGLLAILWYFFFKKNEYRNLILVIVLLVGSLNLIEFFHWEMNFSFSLWGKQVLYLNPVLFFFFLLALIVNHKPINKLIGKKTKPSEESIIKKEETELNNYIRKFKGYSEFELSEIINNPNDFNPMAVKAADIIYQSKKKG